MTKYLIAAVLAVVLAYGLFEAWPLLAGPSLTIDSPIEGGVFADGIVSVSGTALRTNSLTLAGAPLLPDQHGGFSATLTFPHGGSILTFVAADKFGRIITKTRDIFVPIPTTQSTTTNP